MEIIMLYAIDKVKSLCYNIGMNEDDNDDERLCYSLVV